MCIRDSSGTDGQRMAGEPPSRKESGLYSRDRIEQAHRLQAVSYTHLDVYKRQHLESLTEDEDNHFSRADVKDALLSLIHISIMAIAKKDMVPRVHKVKAPEVTLRGFL